MRDVSRSSRSVVRVAMDACCVRCLHRTKRLQRTAKSCGPGAATLASIRPACAGAATVTIKAAHRGELEVSRQTIARGRPGCPGCTCGLTRVHFCSTPTHMGLRAQSAPGLPCALYSRGSNEFAKPGRNHAAGTRAHGFSPLVMLST